MISYEQFLRQILIGLLYYDPLADVNFIRPTTHSLCIFLFCMFLLCRTDQQVEVQIGILLKDKYVKPCQNANTGNHIMISCTQYLRNILIGFLNFAEITCRPMYVVLSDPYFLLLHIPFLHCMDLHPYSTILSQKILRFLAQVEISDRKIPSMHAKKKIYLLFS